MSSLIGAPGERWSLARAIDAMGDAVRQVARPGLIWLSGLFFPSLHFLGDNAGVLVLGLLFQGSGEVSEPGRAILVAGALLVVLGARFTAGLARLGSPELWHEHARWRRTPRLRDAWREGKGLGWSALGLWFQVLAMLTVPALIVLAPPLYLLEHWGWMTQRMEGPQQLLCAAILGPFVAILILLGFVLSVVYQLALQSLVHNRRGTSSALLHAWRIARHDPWATARTVVVDFIASIIVYVAVAVAWVVVWFQLGLLCCLSPVLLLLVFVRKPWVVRFFEVLYGTMLLLLPGFIGVVRAAYWARVYRELGGLSPVDGVPGLASAVPSTQPRTS